MASIEVGQEHADAGERAAPMRILVADDDPDIRFLVTRLLERDGYAVVSASDGPDALRLARESLPDLLILDISMPGADGYAVCRTLQAEAGPGAPPVIFLTAHTHTSARVEGLDAGAVDYIVKPFEHAELTARVRAALRTKTVRDSLAAEAATDPLTGLLNRGQLGPSLASLVAAARRHGRPLACLMADIDRFKAVNDAYGHGAGDQVLREVAVRLRSGKRESDVLVRYGGEEFVALLPETDAAGARTLAEKLRIRVAGSPIPVRPEVGAPYEVDVRISIGVATWSERMTDGAGLVAAADEALFRAKEAGRNRVELAR
jgi:diguanylate cyclase (GGDEF)-like protein